MIRRQRHNLTLPPICRRSDALTTVLPNHLVEVLPVRVCNRLVTPLIRHRKLQCPLEGGPLCQFVVPRFDMRGLIDINTTPL